MGGHTPQVLLWPVCSKEALILVMMKSCCCFSGSAVLGWKGFSLSGRLGLAEGGPAKIPAWDSYPRDPLLLGKHCWFAGFI